MNLEWYKKLETWERKTWKVMQSKFSKMIKKNSLLLVHQTKWQSDLLSKYGGEICLLDATYKTSCYALPLFFLWVKTNVDYCAVASFVVQTENSNAIWQALQVIRDWNPSWNPKFFMVDFCEAEIHAIERLENLWQLGQCPLHWT